MLRPNPFLLVEDNEDHVVLFKRLFAKSKIINPLYVVRNGVEAIAYLEGAGRFRDRAQFPLPSIVFLDLQLPGIDGFEVLAWIRQQKPLAALRVIVLTSFNELSNLHRAYQLGANSFLVKHSDFEDFCRLPQATEGAWVWSNTPINS